MSRSVTKVVVPKQLTIVIVSFCFHCCSPYFCVSVVTFAEIAQLGERQTEDLKVPGSNSESSHEL